jgi:heme exporter protein C
MLLSKDFLIDERSRGLEHKNWYGCCSPQECYSLAGALIPWLVALALVSCTAALYLAFFEVPVDMHDGEAARIVFIHVPASWAAMLMYVTTAGLAGIGLAFNARLAAMAAQALAPSGLMFSFLGLWTGCLWSKAISGSWWAWDLRTHTELVLVLLYLGFIGLHGALEDLRNANKAGALLLFAGVLSVPVHYAAVQPWAAGHQIALPWTMGAAGLIASELASLLAMSLGLLLYAGAASLLRLRCVILERERQSDWVLQRGGGAGTGSSAA